jgi:hypothetical protein
MATTRAAASTTRAARKVQPSNMQVLDRRSAVLTNFEVSELLKKQQRQREEEEAALPLPGARRGQTGAAAWSSQKVAAELSEQVLVYLGKATCAGQTREDIAAFMAGVERFKLTRMECLALVNTPPSSIVEVHLLVEECEERLAAADVRQLLQLCRQYLLTPVEEDEPVGDEAEGDEAGDEAESGGYGATNGAAHADGDYEDEGEEDDLVMGEAPHEEGDGLSDDGGGDDDGD